MDRVNFNDQLLRRPTSATSGYLILNAMPIDSGMTGSNPYCA